VSTILQKKKKSEGFFAYCPVLSHVSLQYKPRAPKKNLCVNFSSRAGDASSRATPFVIALPLLFFFLWLSYSRPSCYYDHDHHLRGLYRRCNPRLFCTALAFIAATYARCLFQVPAICCTAYCERGWSLLLAIFYTVHARVPSVCLMRRARHLVECSCVNEHRWCSTFLRTNKCLFTNFIR
jgi:hypothetical protein